MNHESRTGGMSSILRGHALPETCLSLKIMLVQSHEHGTPICLNSSVYVGAAMGGHLHQADTFRWTIPNPFTCGFLDMKGYARYTETFRVTWPPTGGPPARSLPYTTQTPQGWSDQNTAVHGFRIEWDDFRNQIPTITQTPP